MIAGCIYEYLAQVKSFVSDGVVDNMETCGYLIRIQLFLIFVINGKSMESQSMEPIKNYISYRYYCLMLALLHQGEFIITLTGFHLL